MLTDYLKLTLTDKAETSMTFLEWRTLMNGIGCNSNIEMIDAKLKMIDDSVSELCDSVDGKVDGLTFDQEAGVLQLTYQGAPIEGAFVTFEPISHLDDTFLYSNLGEVANLRVDSLTTARKIPRYLIKNKDDINFTDIRDRRIAQVRAWTDGSEEQAKNPNGQLLYWETDITDAKIGDNGYPYIDDVMVPIVTEETPYPVMIYAYSEGDRWLQTFDEERNFGPIQVWGEGDGSAEGYGKGHIEKLGLSFDIYNQGTDGKKRGVFIGDEYMDFVGRRKTDRIKVSKQGMTVELQGGVSYSYTFGYDDNDNLITMTDGENHVIYLEVDDTDE